MRCWIAACMFLAGCNAPPQEQANQATEKEWPVFIFRHATAGMTTLDEAKKMKLVHQCRLDTGKKSDWTCELYGTEKYPDIPEIASAPIMQNFVYFLEGKLYGINADFHTDNFDKVVSAMRQAYGEPCEIDSKVLQNAFGAQFSGDTVKWCFHEGRLLLSRHTKEDVRHAEFSYWPYEQPQDTPTYDANSI